MKKNTKVISIIVIIILSLIISLNLDRTLSILENKLKEFILPINKLLITTTYSKTKDQTESYLIQKNLNKSLEKEILELKELLKLNSTQSSFDKINATVISRNNQYWLNALIIDKGLKEGVEPGMAVITTNGLIGKIDKVTATSSEVKLLTANDKTYKTSVSIKVNDKNNYAILNGYDEKNNLLKVISVDKNTDIKAGDIVSTSGLGNMPQGIYIGKVISSEIDSYDLTKTIYIKPEQNFSTINYVTILKEKN